MTTDNRNQRNWEPWQLTAYALGELEPDLAAQVELESQSDSKLASELSAIRKTLEEVKSAFLSEKSEPLASGNIDQVFALADQTESASNKVQVARANEQRTSRSNPFRWLPLLAMSACLLVAVVLAAPQLLTTRFLATKSEDKLSPPENTITSMPTTASSENVVTEKTSCFPSPEEFGNGPIAEQPVVAQSSEPVQNRQVPMLSKSPIVSAPADALGGANGIAFGKAGDSYAPSTPKSKTGMDGMGGGMGGMAGRVESGQLLGAEIELHMPHVQRRRERQSYHRASEEDAGAFGGMGGMEGNEGRDSYAFRFPSNWTHPRSSDRYQQFTENSFEQTEKSPLSTFSIDVDTASYAKTRQFLLEANQLPPKNAVRIEEFINYFDYEYPRAEGDKPFAVDLSVASCPWKPEHRLVRIAMQATQADMQERSPANIVFLIDVSGSMNAPNRLPLVQESMRMLVEQLDEKDKVAIVVYAGSAGCVLESTPGNQQATIFGAIHRLQARGSTNGGEGIQLAYNLARDHFIPGGINRVILCTDGDFNVGVTSDEALVDLVAENAKSKIFLTVLGFGMGNTNDSMMEQISGRGNGVYGFVDSWREAKRQMIQQVTGNLITVAKDVKLQVEFNPQHVQAYRLLGYENRVLAAEDFNNDAKDAGDIGAGHRVTALYEIVPVGAESNQSLPLVDDLRYQPNRDAIATDNAEAEKIDGPKAEELDENLQHELLAVKIRYKEPEGNESKLLVFPLEDRVQPFAEADKDFRWAVSVAEFAMLLRGSQYSGNATWSQLLEQAKSAAGSSPSSLHEECLQMIERAAQLNR